MGPDPLDYLTYSSLFLLVVISVFTWMYKRSIKLKFLFKKVFQTKSKNKIGNLSAIPYASETNFEEQSKLFDLEAGQIITIIIIGTICIYPLVMVKKIANENENNLNSGTGRLLVYVSQMGLVFFFFNVIPAQIIFCNPRMMKSILR